MSGRYVYVISATAPDGVIHRYVGSAGVLRERLVWHRSRHTRGKHRNIPADFVVDWDAVEVSGPFIGTPEEVAKGEEQRLFEHCLTLGPVLNKMAPRLTTSDALIAACSIGGKRSGARAARAAQTPEGLAAGRKKSGAITGQMHKVSGHMSRIGKQYGAIQGQKNAVSGHLDRIRDLISPEQMSANGKRNGKISGRIAVESGRLASYNENRTPEERAALAGHAGKARAKSTNARRWGVEVEPGLWISRKTGAVLLDTRPTT